MKYFIHFLFILAFILRLLKLVPNMELVTTAMLLASSYLSRNQALKLTILLMVTTDLFIGNTNIFLFTWSGFLLPILLISRIYNLRSIFKITCLGLASNIFFFIWTNFGVWLLDSWGMYPKTLPGLIRCFINGLPFLRPQLASTLLFVPSGLISYNLLKSLFLRIRRFYVNNFFIPR